MRTEVAAGPVQRDPSGGPRQFCPAADLPAADLLTPGGLAAEALAADAQAADPSAPDALAADTLAADTLAPAVLAPHGPAPDPLTPDCSRCAALCCLALALDRGPAFAIDKPAGRPCPNLSGHACTLHARLRGAGFAGCARYTCHGAGQIVTQALFAGQSWRERPELAAPMMAAFATLRAVQEMRAQIAAARRLGLDAGYERLSAALDARLAPDWTPALLAGFDLASLRREFALWLAALRPAARAPDAPHRAAEPLAPRHRRPA